MDKRIQGALANRVSVYLDSSVLEVRLLRTVVAYKDAMA